MSSPGHAETGAFPMPEMADMPAPILSPTAAVSTVREDPPLRSSCSHCNQAKVRCSKDRPTCRRCATRNTPCVYGVSLRGIKRPRPDQQADRVCQPEEKKRATSLPSPVLSEIFPTGTTDISTQENYVPGWNSDLYGNELANDDLAGLFSLNTFDAPLPDPSAFSLPLDLTASQPVQPLVAPQMAVPPMTIPLSPISPPGSRDGHSGAVCTESCSSPLGSCCCQQSIGYKLTELNIPKRRNSFVMEEFLAEHRANMALCTTVLDCADPQHTPGMQLLIQLIAFLFHMTGAFDQILQGGDMSKPPATYGAMSPSNHRKEQISQANTLRAELAKLGALIQEFDRRYCSLDNASFGQDTFLLSPLFANLQWKTQAKFDAVRSWMPLL
ncbi:hypothetical protein BDW62DRAFT_85818 [Aspergillus aurantiobrunneus]